MCPCCASCTKKVENELPQNELWQLYRAAYEQYQSVIIKGEKSYSRYVNDFIYYHLPCTSIREADIRLHVMHLFALKELLEERPDLVDAFFSKDSFEEKDFLKMDDLFNKGKSLEEPEPVFLAHFNVEQIRLITKFASSTNLFQRKVTEKDIKDLFECRLSIPLQATVNRHVAIFFGKNWFAYRENPTVEAAQTIERKKSLDELEKEAEALPDIEIIETQGKGKK